MGGGGKRGRHRDLSQGNDFQENRDTVWKNTKSDLPNNNPTWHPTAVQNPAFEEYYKEQGIVTPEEWDSFMEVLRKPLPSAFRINSTSQFCDDIRSKLESDFMKSLRIEPIEGGEVEAIRPLPWYPSNLAWHSNFSRKQIRKTQTLERFHEFLKLEHDFGNITRQEAVSMVPPLFLDVHPDHLVLDMCAAPGSKTFQLLEIIHQSTKSGSLPNGMVVANEPDFQRCNLLISQTKRMCTANLVVSNHEGQYFPSCYLNKSLSEIENESVSSIKQLMFDRVLCDVPCSGDGTLRKAPEIWRKWNSGMGNGFHSLQVLLAMRGLSLLKVGGRMVYSTCSMNPVEDEAVVAEILRRCGASVELVDVASELPELVRRPGLKRWKVRDKGIWLSSYKDVHELRKNGILPSMFPSCKSDNIPSDYDQNHDYFEEILDLPLERCIRIMPHDQNTGGFFIAVLHKLSAIPEIQQQRIEQRNGQQSKKLLNKMKDSSDTLEVNSATGEDEKTSTNFIDNKEDSNRLNTRKESVHLENKSPNSKRKVTMQAIWKGFDPVVFLTNNDIIDCITTFYGIDESFPLKGHLVTRNIDMSNVKKIYYVSKSVKDVVELNFAVGQQLKISSVGLKMFERQASKEGSSGPCSFRISSEGLPLILPFITKQIVEASMVDFKHLLQYKSIKFADFVDPDLVEKASNLMTGCCVVVLSTGSKTRSYPIQVAASTIAICCWKGKTSLNIMVAEIDCRQLLERLSTQTEPVEGTMLQGNSDEVNNACN